MLEFCLYINKSDYKNDSSITKLSEQYVERSLFDEENVNSIYAWNNHVSILFMEGKKYQGNYVYSDKNGLTLYTGYIVSDRFDNKSDMVKQLHNILESSNERDWLNNTLGEFIIVHIVNKKVEVLTSMAMTHPVYYRNCGNEIVISNRASLTNITLNNFKPTLNISTQAEVTSFDSIINNNTAFVDTKCLTRGHVLCVYDKLFGYSIKEEKISSLWIEKNLKISSIREAFEYLEPLSDWYIKHLNLMTKQMNISEDMIFNLSGGKDSRLLLMLFNISGLLNNHESILTYGLETDGEARAAMEVARYINKDIPHIVKPRGVSENKFFNKLPYHLFQLEGEINCRVLHGNYLDSRKDLFTGHELGIKESFLSTDTVYDKKTTIDFINNKLPIDPIGFVRNNAKKEIYKEIKDVLHLFEKWNGDYSDFLTWFNTTGRGCRWAGKLTSMSSKPGLYANPLITTPMITKGINMGVTSRINEMVHFTMMAKMDKGILKIPFYNQTWSEEIFNEFKEYDITTDIIRSSNENSGLDRDTMWWDEIYWDNERESIKRIIWGARDNRLDDIYDYEALFKYIDKVKNPSARALLEIYSVISSNLLFQANDITKSGIESTKDIISEIEKDINNNRETKREFFPKQYLGIIKYFKEQVVPTNKIMLVEERYNNRDYDGIFVHTGSEININLPNDMKIEFLCTFRGAAKENGSDQIFEIYCDGKKVFSFINDKDNRDKNCSKKHRVKIFGNVTMKVSSVKETTYGWTEFIILKCSE